MFSPAARGDGGSAYFITLCYHFKVVSPAFKYKFTTSGGKPLVLVLAIARKNFKLVKLPSNTLHSYATTLHRIATTLHVTLSHFATTLYTSMQLPSTFCKAVWPLGVVLDPDFDLGGKLCESHEFSVTKCGTYCPMVSQNCENVV